MGDVGRVGLLPDRLGIVTGLDFEARLARRLSDRVAHSAGVAANVAAAARRLVDGGAQALMSFGIAGGLIPELQPGALIVADKIVTAHGTYPAIHHIASYVRAQVGALYGDLSISSDPADKKALYERTGALAVDLESGEVARVAAEASLPFMAIRAIADPAWRGLPEAALLPLDEKGRPRLSAVFGSIARRPTQIPSLVMVALDTRAAVRSLLRACRVLA